MADRTYSEDQLTKAILMIIDGGISPKEAAKITGISKRTIQRYKKKFLGDQTPEPVRNTELVSYSSDVIVQKPEVQDELDKTILARAKFIDDVIDAKQVVIERIKKVAKRSDNLDALQRTVKTLAEIEGLVAPKSDDGNEFASVKTVNVFQQFNQKLINSGYEGPKLSDADIVKGD